LEGDVKTEIVDGKLVVTPPDGWTWDSEPAGVGFDEERRQVRLLTGVQRTAPDMVALLVPRERAEHIVGGGEKYWPEPLVAAAREALARTAVLIAGPAGCAEVSVEDAQHAAVIVRASINSAEHRVASALRKAAGGS
jgi:hypothetical protein